MIQAFIVRLRQLIALEDKRLDFTLVNEAGTIILPKPPGSVNRTLAQEDNIMMLTRRPQIASKFGYINSFMHHLNIRDDNGESTMQMLVSPWKFSTTEYNLADAECVIAVLDHSLIKNSGRSRSTPTRRLYRPEEYSNFVRLFLDWLVSQNQKPSLRRVAFCLTKTDILPDSTLSLLEMLESNFGHDMLTAIKEHKNRPGIAIELFPISAAGFLDGPGSSPNFKDGQLQDAKRWIPWNVEAPFFWFLQAIEQKKISENGAPLIRRIFRRRRQKHYIRYPL